MLDNARNTVLCENYNSCLALRLKALHNARGKEVGENVAHKGQVTKNMEV